MKVEVISVSPLKTPEKQNLNFPRSALVHMKTRFWLKYFLMIAVCMLELLLSDVQMLIGESC